MELQVTDLMLVWFPSDYHELLQAKAEFSMMCWLPLLFTDCYWDTLVGHKKQLNDVADP